MIIDSHQHFWQYYPLSHSWISEDMQELKKDFLPADLEELYKTNNVDGSVAVQAIESEKETELLINFANENAFIHAVVGWVDLKDSKLELKLRHYSDFSRLKGFRTITQGRPDDEFFQNKDFHNGMRMLTQYNFTYDILIYHYQFKSAIRFAEKFPDQKFMLDHLGKPAIRDKEIKKWKEHIRIISKHPNLYCKLSGMITEADWNRWRYEDVYPYLEIAAENFGVDRLCFGSDWPVCLVAGKYSDVLNIVNKFLQQVGKEDKEKVMAENAIKFYNIT